MDNTIELAQISIISTLNSPPLILDQEEAPATTRPAALTSLAYMLSELASLPSSIDANAPSIDRCNDPLPGFCLPRRDHSQRGSSLSVSLSESAATGATPSRDAALVHACAEVTTSTQHYNVQPVAAEDDNLQYQAHPHTGIIAADAESSLGEATTVAPTIYGCEDLNAQSLTETLEESLTPSQPSQPCLSEDSPVQEKRNHLAQSSAAMSQSPYTSAEEYTNPSLLSCTSGVKPSEPSLPPGQALSSETPSSSAMKSFVGGLDPDYQAEHLAPDVSDCVDDTPALGLDGPDEDVYAFQPIQPERSPSFESHDLPLPQNEAQPPTPPITDEELLVLVDTSEVACVLDDCPEPSKVDFSEEQTVLTEKLYEDDVVRVAYRTDVPSEVDVPNKEEPVINPINCDDPSIGSVSTAKSLEVDDHVMGDDTTHFELEDLPPSSLPASQKSDTPSNAEYTMSLSQESARALSVADDISTNDMDPRASPTRTDTPGPNLIDDLGDYPDTDEATSSILDGPSGPEECVIDALAPAFELVPSSPPPSSSPDRVFSSPGRQVFDSPPSSSPPFPAPQIQDFTSVPPTLENKQEVISALSSVSLKRRLDVDIEDDVFGSANLETKRVKLEDPSPPNPKRPTQASQARQRKKLAAPFRSPVIKGPLVQGGLHAVYASGRPALPSPSRKTPARDIDEEDRAQPALGPTAGVANKDRTAKAAKQFKSPLQASNATSTVVSVSARSSSSSTPLSSVNAAPTIQALQGKVQILKQAIKIKTSGKADEDELLEQLVAKWTTAGREVAWAVWEYVKDLDPGPSTALDAGQKGGWFADENERVGGKRGYDPSWGYDDEHTEKKARMEDGEGEGAVEREDEKASASELPVVQHTLGVMLRRLGIDPATLGWDEEEGDFVDAC